MSLTYKYGLKLWSTNRVSVEQLSDVMGESGFGYIELFAVPGTYDDVGRWIGIRKSGGYSFVIHAPHYLTGLNFADPLRRKENRCLAEDAFRFADSLYADSVIFHPGANGSDEESAKQLRQLSDSRVLVENKPYQGIKPGILCAGHKPTAIKMIMDYSGAGLCLDIPHALSSAVSLKKNEESWLDAFFALRPDMYHLADGRQGDPADLHLRIGEGDFEFRHLLGRIPRGERITIETNRKNTTILAGGLKEIRNLENFCASV